MSMDDWDDVPINPRKRMRHAFREGAKVLDLPRKPAGEDFDKGCICDCASNPDGHVIADCPNRTPLAVVEPAPWPCPTCKDACAPMPNGGWFCERCDQRYDDDGRAY